MFSTAWATDSTLTSSISPVNPGPTSSGASLKSRDRSRLVANVSAPIRSPLAKREKVVPS